MFRVYVATALHNHAEAKAASEALARHDIQTTSSWVDIASTGAVDAGLSEEAANQVHETNYRDLKSSDALLVLRVPEMGEGFVEFAFALWTMKIPIVWVGRPVLSGLVRPDRVTHVKTREEALTVLRR
jgi:hypothetical protein